MLFFPLFIIQDQFKAQVKYQFILSLRTSHSQTWLEITYTLSQMKLMCLNDLMIEVARIKTMMLHRIFCIITSTAQYAPLIYKLEYKSTVAGSWVQVLTSLLLSILFNQLSTGNRLREVRNYNKFYLLLYLWFIY